ncbi:hypothetical protein Pelo_1062 [Pelomyxa schiedti]|nr:hypothetical protein Pelo_1062 [Pelomyxa schiedti]
MTTPSCNVCGCPISDPVLFPSDHDDIPHSTSSSSLGDVATSSSSFTSSTTTSSCGHIMCRGCYRHIACVAQLKNMSRHSVSSVRMSKSGLSWCDNSDQVGEQSASPPGYCVSVECPVAGCGATSLRVSDVSMLIPDATTRDCMLQVMKEKEEEGLCMLGYCMDENSVAKRATLNCLQCKGMLFCESCFQIHHKAPGIKSHKGDPISASALATAYHKCPRHPTKDLDLVCLEETEPMCYLCHITSSHATHKCVPLDDIGSQIRESILGSVSKLEETVALESEAIKGCEASILDAMKSLLSISSTAQSEMDSICQSMKHKTSDLVSTCNLLSSLIEAKVKEHKECLEVCMSTHQRTITRAHEIAKSSDVVSLIAADKKLKETLCECTQLVSSGAMTPCFSAKNIVHHINTHALKEVLDDDDFALVQYHNSITTDPQAAPQFSIKALKGRVVQLEESLAKESVLNSELRAQLEEKQQQIAHLSDLAAHIPTKLEAKVAMSCGPYVSTPNNPETYFPENSLMDDATVFASPLVPFSGEVFIVYQVLSPKRVTAFQLKNRASGTQIVKTFSLLGGDTETGPWTGILNHAAADVSGAVGEYRIADCLQHFRFWKLLLLENNGSNAGCGFVLQYVAFIGLSCNS